MTRTEPSNRDAYLAEIEDGFRSIIRWSRRHSSQLAHDLYQGLDLTALTILSALDDHPQSRLTHVAEWLKLDLSNASRQASLLEAAELIERTTDPHDRRSALLSLSPQGKEVLARARRDSTSFMHFVYRDWDTTELAQFASMITRTIEAIEEIPNPLERHRT
ncbi:MAG: MarR family winged helix-turn-helix transcriptional regulator [Ferrimicrobium sp.]|jgi:DNA-binding MarR family transcriptional regulator|uniref:MarR family winged helix-turn-helix transcriptional regulator n=1 Tax=Ferrimicrobium acidiphilum TaxID=121039 RepID=A0ABV3Y2S4_9ACTN|nr:MarR family winged helix-turn-helix transcriptional regulator [Ferrimicrobium sp.]MCL5972926.1 MarR family winged helix-turn-helix transcriptional regulator [Actinomycetota bacterium]